jgi:hypothetical protein
VTDAFFLPGQPGAPREVAYMRMTKWLVTLTVLASAFYLAAAPAFAQQDQSQQQTGDPVADAARKAREQQKTQPKPKKVFTDDDVKPATRADQPAQPASSGQTQAPGQIQNGSPDKAAAGDKDEKQKDPATMWKQKFADQRAKIANAEKELDVLQREEQKAEVQYYPDPQKALQEQYTRQDINDKLAKIDAKKDEIGKLKQQLDDMEDELRKAGGDPGWAREP